MATNRNTVVQLKSMAKERGLKGYSRLRKADLINFINDARPIPAPRTLAPKPIPAPRPNRIIEAINTYVKPTLIEIKKTFDWGKKSALDAGSFITKKLTGLIGWAKTSTKEKPSPSGYELKERKSALRYDPPSFMRDVRQAVINLMRKNRRTKVKLILRCNMEKNIILTGDVITHKTSFHSKAEVNLEGTDVDDLYNTMVDRVLELMATFQREGSNWTFKSIISLEIHTVAYEPLSGNPYTPLPLKLAQKKGNHQYKE